LWQSVNVGGKIYPKIVTDDVEQGTTESDVVGDLTIVDRIYQLLFILFIVILFGGIKITSG